MLELSSKIFRVPKMLTFDVMAVNLKMPGQSPSLLVHSLNIHFWQHHLPSSKRDLFDSSGSLRNFVGKNCLLGHLVINPLWDSRSEQITLHTLVLFLEFSLMIAIVRRFRVSYVFVHGLD